MIKKFMKVGVLPALMLAATLTSPTIAKAVDFSGKKIQAIVAFKAGGGGTYYTRLYAPYFHKYLPGQPTILVRNIPGGGGIKGSNWFQRNAKPDGLTYSVISSSNLSSMVLGGKKVKYDLRKWEFIMMEPMGSIFYARPETGVKGKNIRDDVTALRNKQIVCGAKSPTSSELHQFLVFNLLGITNVKPVFGTSSGGQRKAILRGEFNLKRDSTLTYFKHVEPYVKKGVLIPWMALGFWQNGKIVRDPAFPNLPTIVEAYKAVNGGKEPSGIAYEAFLPFFHIAVTASKGFALPPHTPKAIVDAYIEAAKKTLKDKDFAKRVGRMYGVYPVLFGKKANEIARMATDLSPKVRKYIKTFIKNKLGVNT